MRVLELIQTAEIETLLDTILSVSCCSKDRKILKKMLNKRNEKRTRKKVKKKYKDKTTDKCRDSHSNKEKKDSN